MITGFVRLIVNGVLDIIVLVGLLGMAPSDYITRIGLRYLMIPAMVIAAGIIADGAALWYTPSTARAGTSLQVYSVKTFAAIRKIIPAQRADRTQILKKSTFFYKGASIKISCTARETREINGNGV